MNRIKKTLVLLKGGKGLISKFVIFSYLFGDLLKIKDYKKFLFKDISIESSTGQFYVRKKTPYDLWMGSNVEDEELEESLNLKEGVFIDVGANIGKYTIKIGNQLKNKGRVISFEPEEENFEMLERNVKLNNLKNVSLIKKALSYEKGKLKLFLAEEDLGCHSIFEKVGEKY